MLLAAANQREDVAVVLRKSLAHAGLAKGLDEGAKVIEKHTAQLCVLAEDCDQPDYVSNYYSRKPII
ncbi:hypothetical protein LIER_37714 [Lithospermum erythrorhizon]|uniref:40S ribosomal protein S12 n=1 Tax=Lithospermum erythrorhizon TaxID=34254 RepID=A0AAV3PQ18_LITER